MNNLVQSQAPLSEVAVTRWRNGIVSEATDKVAEEVPIGLIYNGISHAVMLATPQDLEDFALGFSLSEGILHSKSELYDVEIVAQPLGIELRLDVATQAFVKLKDRRRNLVGRTGCGLCGAESLEQALRLPALENSISALTSIHAPSSPVINASIIITAFRTLQTNQVLQQATGATHACAWVNVDGAVQLLREDVGRHNAMDKLIGALAKLPKQNEGFVLTSSRASVEMVQKVALAGINILAAISAPTGLAIRVAEQYGVTLVGFLRDNQFVIYTHSARIKS
ncbi:MAG: formate dehydrogenase accessory sulfurtransferase FdhD [Bdellovibrio sp.]|nr:formate dehydrogenase accessory sulfurtransferase FdhD [Methylotenera sp.]